MVSLIELREKLANVPWLGLPMLILWTSSPISQQEEEGLFVLGMICVVYIVIFVVWIMLAIWVYRDAKTRGMSGALWLLIVLITGILGLIIYLVVRHDKQPEGYYPPPGQYPPQYQQPYQQPPQQYQQPYQQPPDQQPPPPQGQTYDPETGQYK